jgi:hypothetical protein
MSDEEHTLTVDQIPCSNGHGQTWSDYVADLNHEMEVINTLANAVSKLNRCFETLESKINKIAKFLDIEDEL